MTRCKLRNQRPKAFWGALLGGLVPSLFGFTGSIIAAKQQANAIRRQQEEQAKLAREQNKIMQNNAIAKSLNSYADGENMIDEDKYLGKYALGGNIKKGRPIAIAGGHLVNTPIPGLKEIKGLKHGQINSKGGNGVTIAVNGTEFDGERGEGIYRNEFVLSKQKKLGLKGLDPMQLALVTGNPKYAAIVQETNKKRLGIKTPPVEKRWGDYIGTPEYINLGGDILGAFGNLASNWMLSGVNIKPVLAQSTDAVAVSIPERVKSWGKYRSLARAAGKSMRDVSRNTASSNVANSLRQNIATNEAEEYAKLYDEDYAKTLENIKFNAQNEQQTRLANQEARNRIALANQQTQMQALQANTDIAMQRAKNIGAFVGDLGKSAVNLGNQYIQNRNDYNSLAAYLATAGDATVDRFLNLGFDVPANVRRTWEKYKINRALKNPYNPKGLAFPTLEASLKVPTIKRVPGLSLS